MKKEIKLSLVFLEGRFCMPFSDTGRAAKKIGFEILAVHVNHGIRGEEAKADEEFVKTL